MHSPKISIVIPVYNAERFLPECLQSLTDQIFSDLEIICIDDGSTDNSLHILNSYATRCKKIIVLTQHHAGQGAARNLGVNIAHGRYIGFVDADDYIAPMLYNRLLAVCEQQQVDIAVCRAWTVDVHSEECHPLHMWDTLPAGIYTQQDIAGLDFFNTGCSPVLWNKLIRSEIVKTHPSTNQPRGQDFLALIDFIAASNKIQFIDDRLYYYRHHRSSVMAQPKSLTTISADLITESIALRKIALYYPDTLTLHYYLNHITEQWNTRLQQSTFNVQEKQALINIIAESFQDTESEQIFSKKILTLLRG